MQKPIHGLKYIKMKAEIFGTAKISAFYLVYFLVDYSIFAKVPPMDCRRGCFLGKHKILQPESRRAFFYIWLVFLRMMTYLLN